MKTQVDWLIDNGFAESEEELIALAVDRWYRDELRDARIKESIPKRELSSMDRAVVESWITEATDSTPQPDTKLSDLYQCYVDYTTTMHPGLPILSPQGLGRQLIKLVQNKRRMDGRYYALKLKEFDPGPYVEAEVAQIFAP